VKSTKSPKVVLDTNVLISALVFGGKPREVTELLVDTIIVVYSQEILTELRRIILLKFPAFSEDLQRLEKLLERDALRVELGSTLVTVSRDPDDNKFIETALIGGCQYIVSGDEDLLVIKKFKNIQILKPADFLKLLDS
jgi:putative PIN family toxin of toxin-antitoxin system